MNVNELKNKLEELISKRNLFHSEADFQHSFALLLKNNDSIVRLEKPFYSNKKIKKIELDIFLKNKNENIGIELKYKTRKISNNKEIKIQNEKYRLSEQGAQNLGRYDFFKDVERLQQLKDEKKIEKGYVVFLTNDPSYWKGAKKGTLSEKFCIKENRVINENSELSWPENTSEKSISKTRTGSIIIKKKLHLNWKKYSSPKEIELLGSKQFKYLLSEI